MGKAKSTTRDASGLVDAFCGTKTYKTTISDGRRKTEGYGSSRKTSQKNASKKWDKR